MRVSSLGWRTDLTLRRLAGSQVADRGDHLVVRTPANPLFWWGNFLLLESVPAPADCPAWVDRFAAEFPTAGHVAIGIDAPHGTRADIRWFTEHDFAAEASTVLTATQVHLPRRHNTAARCLALAGDGDWAQSLALQRRAYDGPGTPAGTEAFSAAQSLAQRRLAEDGHGAWFGAFLDGRLVSQLGLVACPDEMRGGGLARFQNVETDPDFYRQGLAGTLVHHAARWGLDELGAGTLVIVADPDYWAIELYRRVGFTATEVQLQAARKPRT